jgi:hypothetical protein
MSFQWGDYTVNPDTLYEYRLVPVRGNVKNLQLADAEAVTLRITAEKENDIAGSHVVTVAWDIDQPSWKAFSAGLLGFAIERTELDAAGAVVEKYWLRGMARMDSGPLLCICRMWSSCYLRWT